MTPISRRRFLELALGVPVLVACTQTGAAPDGEPQALTPTPACGDADDVTPEQTAGPFFKPDSPERTSLVVAGANGTPLVVTGVVVSTNCQPIGGALLDFWQADDAGDYDNTGFGFRGHQFANDEGRWRLSTIMPGLYPGRTRHIHVRVQAPDQPILTTQLYFPDEPTNQLDGIFDAQLLMELQSRDDEQRATFTFVLDVS